MAGYFQLTEDRRRPEEKEGEVEKVGEIRENQRTDKKAVGRNFECKRSHSRGGGGG